MRRFAAIACLTLPLAGASGAAAAQERPRVQARLAGCTTGAAAAARTASFTASMAAIEGSARMWMRFVLLERTAPDAGFVPVRVPGWGRWERSDAGRTGFIFTKRVRGLRAPGAYRARVRFRWYGPDGRLLRRARRTTRTCRQPDPRPDLEARELSAAPGLASGTATYLLTVTNAGRGDAGAFEVVLTTAGMAQAPVAADGLAAGASRVLSIAGPRCAPGSTVRFVLDASARVDEADEDDDVVDRPCPFTA